MPRPAPPLEGWLLGFLFYWIASTVVGVWIIVRGGQGLAGYAAQGASLGSSLFLVRLVLVGITTALTALGCWHLLRPSLGTRRYWDRALPAILGFRCAILGVGILEWLLPPAPGRSPQSLPSLVTYVLLTVAVTGGWLLWWRRTARQNF